VWEYDFTIKAGTVLINSGKPLHGGEGAHMVTTHRLHITPTHHYGISPTECRDKLKIGRAHV